MLQKGARPQNGPDLSRIRALSRRRHLSVVHFDVMEPSQAYCTYQLCPKDIVVYSFMKEQATLPGKTVIVRRKHDGPALANSIRFSISTPLCRPQFFAKGIPVAKAAQLIREVLRLQNLSRPKRRSPSRSNATARPAAATAAATLQLWPSNRRSDGSRARSALASRVQTAVNHTEAGRTRAARYGLQDLP